MGSSPPVSPAAQGVPDALLHSFGDDAGVDFTFVDGFHYGVEREHYRLEWFVHIQDEGGPRDCPAGGSGQL